MYKLYVIQLLVTWALSALALILMSAIMPRIRLSGIASAFLASLVLGLLNTTVLRILWVLTFPLTILTLGLFLLLLNGAMLKLTARIVSGFKVDGWLAAIFGSIVLSITHAGVYYFYRRIAE